MTNSDLKAENEVSTAPKISFTKEQKDQLKQIKEYLMFVIDSFQLYEEMTQYEIQCYAIAKSIMDMPEYKMNIILAHNSLKMNTMDLSKHLKISRPTLSTFLKITKNQLRKNANNITELVNYQLDSRYPNRFD